MKGMSDQRLMDLGSIKHACLTYVPSDMENRALALVPVVPKIKDKSMRGFNHPQIARLLCPCKKLDDFDLDPERFACHMNRVFTNTL